MCVGLQMQEVLVWLGLLAGLVGGSGCPGGGWACSGAGQCVLRERVCDGRPDCSDGSDEAAAVCAGHTCDPLFLFQCGEEAGCVSTTQVCNGRPDCRDGSDEANCGAGTAPTSPAPHSRASHSSLLPHLLLFIQFSVTPLIF